MKSSEPSREIEQMASILKKIQDAQNISICRRRFFPWNTSHVVGNRSDIHTTNSFALRPRPSIKLIQRAQSPRGHSPLQKNEYFDRSSKRHRKNAVEAKNLSEPNSGPEVEHNESLGHVGCRHCDLQMRGTSSAHAPVLFRAWTGLLVRALFVLDALLGPLETPYA